jgi:hypothetical protein
MSNLRKAMHDLFRILEKKIELAEQQNDEVAADDYRNRLFSVSGLMGDLQHRKNVEERERMEDGDDWRPRYER